MAEPKYQTTSHTTHVPQNNVGYRGNTKREQEAEAKLKEPDERDGRGNGKER